jgi:hypothetical protein
VYAWRAWRRGWWSPGARVHYLLATVCAGALPFFLWNWNLLGWRF